MTIETMTPARWILEGETGTSSKTIWAVLTGAITIPQQCDFCGHYDIPHDPDDFKRCLKLLSLFPAWRDRLEEVGKIFPKWQPFVREWRRMENLYIEEIPSGQCPKLYALMEELIEEGMPLDGWTKTMTGNWTRDESGPIRQ